MLLKVWQQQLSEKVFYILYKLGILCLSCLYCQSDPYLLQGQHYLLILSICPVWNEKTDYWSFLAVFSLFDKPTVFACKIVICFFSSSSSRDALSPIDIA